MATGPTEQPIPTSETEKPRVRLSRRKLFLRASGGTALAVGGGYAYSRWIEPFHPVVERVDVPVARLPRAFDGYRIAHLSDLHIQPGFPAEKLKPAIELVQREKPDLVVLTGDYVYGLTGERDRYMSECAGAVKAISAPGGVFACFGNHDFPVPPADPPLASWREAGITPLLDEVVELSHEGHCFFLIGLRSFISRPVSPAAVLHGTPASALRIVLWHEPDRAEDAARAGASLQLSGHTHGGQVVVPGYGPPILPVGGRKYPAGLYEVAGMPLYVTRGVGVLPPLVRLNCPPEVSLLTLRPQSGQLRKGKEP